jgi:hypothetical protein
VEGKTRAALALNPRKIMPARGGKNEWMMYRSVAHASRRRAHQTRQQPRVVSPSLEKATYHVYQGRKVRICITGWSSRAQSAPTPCAVCLVGDAVRENLGMGVQSLPASLFPGG